MQKFGRRGSGSFGDSDYQKAVDAALGERLQVVNGIRTIVPLDVKPGQFDDAVDMLTDADWQVCPSPASRRSMGADAR